MCQFVQLELDDEHSRDILNGEDNHNVHVIHYDQLLLS